MSEYVTSLKSLFKTGAEKVVQVTGRVVEKTEDVVHTVGETVQGYLDPPERYEAETQTDETPAEAQTEKLTEAYKSIVDLELWIDRLKQQRSTLLNAQSSEIDDPYCVCSECDWLVNESTTGECVCKPFRCVICISKTDGVAKCSTTGCRQMIHCSTCGGSGHSECSKCSNMLCPVCAHHGMAFTGLDQPTCDDCIGPVLKEQKDQKEKNKRCPSHSPFLLF